MDYKLPPRKIFALSDNSIAVTDDENPHSIISIYEIIPPTNSNSNQQLPSAKKKVIIGNDLCCFGSQKRVKKIKYSVQLMDNKYSARYISLSKGGRFLALSWLPNPRLGPNPAMKYCSVYDLLTLRYKKSTKADQDIQLTLPFNLIEFQGGCSFTTKGDLVLINRNEIKLYKLKHNQILNLDSFELAFSLNLEIYDAPLHPHYTYFNSRVQYNLYYPPAIPSFIALPNQNQQQQSIIDSTTTNVSDDYIFDDIFFETPNASDEEMFSCSEDEGDNKEDSNSKREESIVSEELKKNVPSQYDYFCENRKFIFDNIDDIKSSGVIHCIHPLTNNKDSNGTKTEEDVGQRDHVMLVWSLQERSIIFSKKINKEDYDADAGYIFALTENKNLIAFAKRHNPKSINNLKAYVDEPLFKIYDCESGLAAAQLYIPKDRLIEGVSQLLFVQDNIYIIAITYSFKQCYFDIWDVLSATHLDSYEVSRDYIHMCTELSTFIPQKDMQLKCGCGVFLKISQNPAVTMSSNSNEMIDNNEFLLSTKEMQFNIQGIHFFDTTYKKHNYKKEKVSIRRAIAKNGLHEVIYGEMHISVEKEKTISERRWPAFYVDECQKHLMVYTWNCKDCDVLTATIWRTVKDNSGYIELQNVIYSFSYNLIAHLDNIIGHPANLFNLSAAAYDGTLLGAMNPSIICPKNVGETPILLIQFNDPYHTTDYSMILRRSALEQDNMFDEQEYIKPYTVAIPLNSCAVLECHLHAMANEHVKTDPQFWNKEIYRYSDFVDIPLTLTGLNNGTVTRDDVLRMIREQPGYFSTMAGYASICRLASSDSNNAVLDAILQPTTVINYCTLSRLTAGDISIDPLKEALTAEAIKNIKTIVRHIKYSVAHYGIDYGHILLSNQKLLQRNNINIDACVSFCDDIVSGIVSIGV